MGDVCASAAFAIGQGEREYNLGIPKPRANPARQHELVSSAGRADNFALPP
jgi:hypothetical protein